MIVIGGVWGFTRPELMNKLNSGGMELLNKLNRKASTMSALELEDEYNQL